LRVRIAEAEWRGRTWRTDCYPTPGASMPVKGTNGQWIANGPGQYGGNPSRWPWKGYQDLMPRESFRR
jgi:hypothetical protein